MYFSEKIEIIRKELELNQKDFATKIGLSQNAVSQYITGKRKPDYATIQKLIDLGVSPLFLFFNFNEPFDDELNVYIKDRKEKELNSEIAAKEKEIEELRKKLS
jgi:transcriptional regulator with XRE-family HTH domain